MVSERILFCVVNGPWQALSLAASLAQLGLPSVGSRCVTLLVDMTDGSPIHAATQRVLRDNGFSELHTLAAGTPLRRLPAALATICALEQFALAQVETIATYGVHRPIGRYLVHALPDAKLLIYEEGLRAYVPHDDSLRQRVRVRAAQLWGQLDRPFGMAWTPVQATRETAYCFLLGERLGLPAQARDATVHQVRREALQRACAAVSAPDWRQPPGAPCVLIVGQYYADLKQMTYQTELDAYAAAARSIAARGLIPVWRGHIRKRDAFFEPLRAACPTLRAFGDLVSDASLPLELYGESLRQHCVAAVSFSSSALFYLAHVHGLATYTLLSEALLQRMNHPHRDACLLARAHLSAFEGSSWT